LWTVYRTFFSQIIDYLEYNIKPVHGWWEIGWYTYFNRSDPDQVQNGPTQHWLKNPLEALLDVSFQNPLCTAFKSTGGADHAGGSSIRKIPGIWRVQGQITVGK
jgi:hypothetical protein